MRHSGVAERLQSSSWMQVDRRGGAVPDECNTSRF